MAWYANLPHLNAFLNASSAALLLLGYISIRRKLIARHHRFMLACIATSGAFLLSYLIYHAQAGSVRFQGQGWIRPFYFGILLSHTVLAAVIVPLVLYTVLLAFRKRFDTHRRVARWTFPVWMYVSITGVLVYLMLYHW
jgi:uncharacterized membrane protein YozB (DUF420 family)